MAHVTLGWVGCYAIVAKPKPLEFVLDYFVVDAIAGPLVHNPVLDGDCVAPCFFILRRPVFVGNNPAFLRCCLSVDAPALANVERLVEDAVYDVRALLQHLAQIDVLLVRGREPPLLTQAVPVEFLVEHLKRYKFACESVQRYTEAFASREHVLAKGAQKCSALASLDHWLLQHIDVLSTTFLQTSSGANGEG